MIKPGASVRMDKWLWAARFFKTRGLAQTALDNGRVLLFNQRAKRARAIQIGDELTIRIGDVERVVVVKALSAQRGPAPQAQALYQETGESFSRRAAQRAKRKLFADPAAAIAAGRPTKRDRRRIQEIRQNPDIDSSFGTPSSN